MEGNERNVTVNVDARPPRASWLWKVAGGALLLGVLLELSAIERHLRLIAEAQTMQAIGASLPSAPDPEPSKSGYRLNSKNRVAEVNR